MNPFALSSEQLAIRDMAKAFADDRLAGDALAWDQQKFFPVDVLREAAALGMAGIYVREEAGGSGLTRLDAALDLRGAGDRLPDDRGLHLHPQHGRLDDRPVRHRRAAPGWLPKLCVMDALASYCLTEPGAGSDAAALTHARRCGTATPTCSTAASSSSPAPASSDLYLTMARTGGGGAERHLRFLIEKGTPGLSFGAEERKMGWNAQPTRQVIFEDAACRPPTARRGRRRLQDRHGRARRRAAQYRRLLARRRAGGAGQGARLHGGAGRRSGSA